MRGLERGSHENTLEMLHCFFLILDLWAGGWGGEGSSETSRGVIRKLWRSQVTVKNSNFEANQSSGSWLMIGQTNVVFERSNSIKEFFLTVLIQCLIIHNKIKSVIWLNNFRHILDFYFLTQTSVSTKMVIIGFCRLFAILSSLSA